MTSQDLVLVLGAYSFFVLGALGLLAKFVLDTRKNSNETNRMVNGRPDDPTRPNDRTLRDLIEHIDQDVSRLRDESFARHRANSRRIDNMSGAMDRNVKKLDLLGDAIAGANNRLDALDAQRDDG